MTGNDPKLNELDHEQLVSYLDGELDAEASSEVEQRLASDAEFRRSLLQLQRSWELLDDLPHADVKESFTQSTVEMVALSAIDDASRATQAHHRRRSLLTILGGTGIALTAVLTFLAVQYSVTADDRELLRDLPVIENLDTYRMAESIEFLRALESKGLFEEEVDDAL